MLKEVVIMLNYAPVKNESYYAQNYAGIMCQGLVYGALVRPEPFWHATWLLRMCGRVRGRDYELERGHLIYDYKICFATQPPPCAESWERFAGCEDVSA